MAAARAARPLDALGPRSSGAAGAKERVRFGRVTVRPPCKAKGAHIKLGRSSRMWLQQAKLDSDTPHPYTFFWVDITNAY